MFVDLAKLEIIEKKWKPQNNNRCKIMNTLMSQEVTK